MPQHVFIMNDLGEAKDRDEITITDTITIVGLTSGYRHIEIYNSGGNDVYKGGPTTVSSARGIPIFSEYSVLLNNCQSTFKVGLVCATGQSSTVRITEYMGIEGDET